jgi:succinate dehydrogenase / fumarate reductase membrane anchor subunit
MGTTGVIVAMSTVALPNRVTVRKVKPRSRSLESYAWLFMRLSGVALLLLAVGHMIMQHITHDVHAASWQWVIDSRWSLLWIRVWDFLLLGLAFIHGLNGFHTVLVDYVHNVTALKVLRLLIVGAGGVILLIGAAAIIGAPMPVR